MAEMIPESLPSGKPKGEREVFDVLQNLPDDYLVYYEPIISDRYPDFVVIGPDLGLLIIEVKGRRSGTLLAANPEQVKISRSGQPVSEKHPIAQAREYKHYLMDKCQRAKDFSILCSTSGEYSGKFSFPVNYLVVFPYISRQDLTEKGLAEVFPTNRVVTSDVFETWKRFEPRRLKEELKPFLPTFWTFPKLDRRKLDVLRALVHPEIIVGPHASNPKGAELLSLKVLDLQQEVVARKIGDGHRVLNGVAGSGKTILLVHRANMLAKEAPEKRILVVCYNRTLSAFLKAQLNQYPSITVKTFHSWGMSSPLSIPFDREKEEEFVMNLKEKLGRLDDEAKYDAVFVDEAQDFEPTWLECLVAALKDPDDGDLIVVADGNQGIYKPKSFKWKDVKIKAVGRVIPLRTNYRNTKEILEFASRFAEAGDLDTGEEIVALAPEAALRNGPPPLVIPVPDRTREIRRAVQLVNGLLKGQWESDLGITPLAPDEIAILYPYSGNSEKQYIIDLRKELRSKTKQKVVWLNENRTSRDRVGEPGIKIVTIHSAKGLQFRAVILIFADLLPVRWEMDEGSDRRLMYVALTRAEDYLAVTHVGASKFTQMLTAS